MRGAQCIPQCSNWKKYIHIAQKCCPYLLMPVIWVSFKVVTLLMLIVPKTCNIRICLHVFSFKLTFCLARQIQVIGSFEMQQNEFCYPHGELFSHGLSRHVILSQRIVLWLVIDLLWSFLLILFVILLINWWGRLTWVFMDKGKTQP